MPREHRGDIAGVDYTVEWMPNSGELTLTLMTRLMPAVRMTQRSKWSGRAKEYVDINNAIRDRVLLIMREHDLLKQDSDGNWLPLFDKETNLWLRGGAHYKLRGSTPPDATNLLKACEDALQGVLYGNDSQIEEVSFKKTRVRHEHLEGFWVELRPMPRDIEAIKEVLS